MHIVRVPLEYIEQIMALSLLRFAGFHLLYGNWKDLPTHVNLQLKCVCISEENCTLSTIRPTNEINFLYVDDASYYT